VSAFLRTLEHIADETRVLGHDWISHAALGRVAVRDPAGGTGAADPVERFLTSLLYLHYHARDRRGVAALLSGESDRSALPAGEDPGFADGILAGVVGEGYLVEGFEVAAVDGDHVDLEAHGLRLRARRSDLRWSGPLRAGGEASVRFPPYRRYLQRGRLLVVGDACTGGPRPEDVVRCYLRPRAASVPAFTAGLTGRLNTLRVRFQLKLASHPDGHERTDAVVAYVPLADWDRVRGPVDALCADFADDLTGETPCFALRIRPGWAVAVDRARPGSPSFGRSRCAMVARGLVAARRTGPNTAGHRFASVFTALKEEGVDPRRPYLDPALDPPSFPEPAEAG
jgi:hypothetical protein